VKDDKPLTADAEDFDRGLIDTEKRGSDLPETQNKKGEGDK
jgi:hypothetical protein